jgi:DNA replication protein DnaC
MASKCQHCRTNDAQPIMSIETKKLDTSLLICRACSETKEYWDFPFKYSEVFEKRNVKFIDYHPDYPQAFLNTDVAFSPVIAKAMAWKPADNKCGLILHGETGTCKSRTAWLLFNKMWLANYPKKAMFLQMRKFERIIENSFEDRDHGNSIDSLIKLPLLVLDDLGKERLTVRMETDLFSIIDERTSNLMPTIITTNYTGSTLCDRFNNKETGTAFVRRLRDYFDSISA